MKGKIYWGRMNKNELDQRSKGIDTAILPIGSLEQHGPHLPLDIDSYDAEYLVKKTVEKLEPPRPPILPTISYGVSDHHMSFPGTVTLNSETLEKMILEIGKSIIEHGFSKLYICNGHGGNEAGINSAAQKLKKESDMMVIIESFQCMMPEKKELIESKNDVHAGEFETSAAMANRGKFVDEEAIPEKDVNFLHPKMEFDHEPNFIFTWKTHELTETGVIGDATKATKEKGEKLWEAAIERFKERLEIVIDLSP